MDDRKKLIQALVDKQQIDQNKHRERRRFYGGGKYKPIKHILGDMEPTEKLVFLSFVSSEFFTLSDINKIFRSKRRFYHYSTMKKLFLKIWQKKKQFFPDEKIREVESRFSNNGRRT